MYDGSACLQPLSRESTTGQLLCFKLIERAIPHPGAQQREARKRQRAGAYRTCLEQFGNLILSPLLALKLLPLLDGARLLFCSRHLAVSRSTAQATAPALRNDG